MQCQYFDISVLRFGQPRSAFMHIKVCVFQSAFIYQHSPWNQNLERNFIFLQMTFRMLWQPLLVNYVRDRKNYNIWNLVNEGQNLNIILQHNNSIATSLLIFMVMMITTMRRRRKMRTNMMLKIITIWKPCWESNDCMASFCYLFISTFL